MMRRRMSSRPMGQSYGSGMGIAHVEPAGVHAVTGGCQFAGCPAQASMGYDGYKPVYCPVHAGDGMMHIDPYARPPPPPAYTATVMAVAAPSPAPVKEEITSCQFGRCKGPASFGYSDEKIARYCEKHKEDEMILVKKPKSMCHFGRCTEPATFGYADCEPEYCRKHADEDMEVNKKKGMCSFSDCDQKGLYTYPKGYASETACSVYCDDHRDETMEFVAAAAAPEPTTPPPQTDALAADARGAPAGTTITAAKDLPVATVVDVVEDPAPIPEELNEGPNSAALGEYKKCGMELASLKHAKEDKAQNDYQIAEYTQQLSEARSKLAELQAQVAALDVRIERQKKKPHLGGSSLGGYGLFVQDEAKIAKLESELKDLQANVFASEADIASDNSMLEDLRTVSAGLANAATRQRQLEGTMQGLFADVISNEAETPALIRGRADRAIVMNLQNGLQQVMEGMKRAKNQFGTAMRMSQAAQRKNMAAAVTNVAGMGRGRGRAGMGRGGFGLEVAEKAMQASRNKSTAEAMQAAGIACEMLEETFKSVSPELHARYPSYMSKVGKVPLPDLWRGKFGRDIAVGLVFGDLGDAVNQARAARMISDNIRQIANCLHIIDEQLALLDVVHKHLQMEFSRLDKSIRAEKMSTFHRAMAREDARLDKLSRINPPRQRTASAPEKSATVDTEKADGLVDGVKGLAVIG